MSEELDRIARAIIDGNRYMVLGTADQSGRPWVSPVYYAPSGYAELYWVSSPEAQHSRNLGVRPELSIVVFDSQAPVGEGQGVYMSAVAEPLTGDDAERGIEIFSLVSVSHGARPWTLEDVQDPAVLRLYRARVSEHWVLDPERRPDQRTRSGRSVRRGSRPDRADYPAVMGRSPIDEAFAHHVWATLRLIDSCLELTPEQLEAAVPGTYGSILETMRHLVGGDTYYLAHLTGDPAREIDSDGLGLGELRAEMEADERTWIELLARDLDPDAVVKDVDEEGYAAGCHDRCPARPGDPPRNRPPEPDLHGFHDARRRAAADRCLGVRPPDRPRRRDLAHHLAAPGDATPFNATGRRPPRPARRGPSGSRSADPRRRPNPPRPRRLPS